MALVIKAKLGDDVRRVEIEETDFKNLKRTLRRLFALGDIDFTVKYLDDEGDAVSLTCDKELQEALHFVVPANPRPFLRLTVHPVTPVPTPAPTPIAAPEPASPASAPASPGAAAPAPRGRCPYAAQRRQQRQQAHQQARQQPAAAFPLPFHLLRGVPLGAFTQQQPQQPQQQSCNAAINDVVSGLMAQPEIRQLAETFGIKPDAVPSQVDELLRAFLPTPQPEQQETKGKEKEDKPSSSSIPTNVNDLFQNEELRQLISAFGLKPDDVAGEVDSLLRNVLPPEFFNNNTTTSPKSEEKEKETPKSAEPVKHHAWCDRCNTQIEGVRYKCGMCSDYDLCESCEALTATDSSVHDPTHLFIKVRQSTYLGTFPLIRGVVHPGAAGGSQCRAGWRQRRGGGCHRQWWQQQQQQHQQQQSEAPEDVTVVVDVIVEPEILEAINKAKAAAEPAAKSETQQPSEPVAESEPEPVSVPSSPVPTPKTETVVIEELDEEEKVIKVTPLVRLVPHSAPAPAATPAPVPEEAPKSEPIAAAVEPVQEPKKEEYRFAAEAEQLAAMGFTDAIANRLALDQNGGNLIAAVNALLG